MKEVLQYVSILNSDPIPRGEKNNLGVLNVKSQIKCFFLFFFTSTKHFSLVVSISRSL